MRATLGVLLCLALPLAACGDDEAEAEADAGPAVPVEADPEGESDVTDDATGEDGDDGAGGGAEESAPNDAEPTPTPVGGPSLNGFRYCEILVTVEGGDQGSVTEVWGTPGVGPCEDDAWYALDPEAVAADFGASSIHMNGPRYFTVDGFAETAPTTEEADTPAEVRDVGGIAMTLLATVDAETAEPGAYTPGLVVRTVTMAYRAGTEIYELTDPDGNTYVMQSYALIHDRDLTAEDLATLGDRLELPDGWSYRARVLDADLQLGLAAEGAIVVQDELENSYQRHVETGATPVSSDATPCDAAPSVSTTTDGVDFVRTPDSCFDDLPDWPYEPHYVEIDGLRQAYVDEGPAGGEVVLLLHGQPSWSYLYRDMIPVLVDAGYRVIAMDHVGMGRSDKPIDIEYYSYLGHGERIEDFIAALGLRDINLFVQDWGSLIGLKVAGENPELFATITVGNGNLPVVPDGFTPYAPVENPDELADLASPFAAYPDQQIPIYDGCELLADSESAFFADWMRYAMTAESFTAGQVVEALTWYDLTAEEEAAYDAPFPDRAYMAGPRVFPSLVNQLGGTTADAWAGLQGYDKPFLTLWGGNDPGSLGACATQQRLIDNVPGAAGQPHDRVAEASHFLQDDQGTELATRIVDWLDGLQDD